MINLLAVIPGSPAARRPRRSRFSASSSRATTTRSCSRSSRSSAPTTADRAPRCSSSWRAPSSRRTLPMDVELLFLDGEEAVGEWQGERSHLRQPLLRPGREEGRDAQDHRRARPRRHDRRQGLADHARVELDALAHRVSVGRRLQARPPRVRRRDDDDRGRSPRVPRGRRARRSTSSTSTTPPGTAPTTRWTSCPPASLQASETSS